MNQYCYDIRRIFTLYYEAKQILAGEMPIPRMAILYPTFVCNQRCIYCLFGEMNEKYKCSIETELLMRVIDEIGDLGTKAIEFCGGGEPLTHPGITEAIRKMIDRQLKFGILSNFSISNPGLLDLIAKNASYVRASIDTFDENIYRVLHRPGGKHGLAQVLDNMKDIIRIKQNENSELQVGIKILLTKLNYKNLTKTTEQAIDMGFDSIQLKMARHTEVEIRDKQTMDEINDEISQIRDRYGKGIKVLGNLRDRGEIEKTGITRQCWLTPIHIVITPTGDVPLCCYCQEPFRDPSHIYGNIKEQPLRDIWYSNKHWEAINRINIEECNRYDCRWHIYNEVMYQALVLGKGQWQFI